MQDILGRTFEDLIARLTGPMQFRLYFQPAMALFFAIRDGRRDAHEGKPAYFWAIFYNRSHRSALLKSGLKAVGRVLFFGIIMDVIYQIIVQRWVYPGEAVIVAFILAFLPYLLSRGPINRIVKWWMSRPASQQPGYRPSR
ncbi:MAG TPA: hypothetical protein VGG46_11570 [Terriglobales bacterium]